jgi:hypothetical protein
MYMYFRRAGRPGFDNTGVAVIMTSSEEKKNYEEVRKTYIYMYILYIYIYIYIYVYIYMYIYS